MSKNMESVIIVVIIVAVVVPIMVSVMGGDDESKGENVQQLQEDLNKNDQQIEAPREEIKEEPVEEPSKPDWYGKAYTVTTYDPATDSKVGTVALWNTSNFNDPNRTRTGDQFVDGDKVILVGYNETEDYCRVTQDNADNKPLGWFACAWLEEVPYDMKDLWIEPL